MSETEKFVGKFQLRPRLKDESDKDYFERVTDCKWQKYNYKPDSIMEAIYDNDITYYEAKHGKKGYFYLNDKIYEIIEIIQKDIEETYCNVEKIDENTFSFEAQFYNGGCSLSELISEVFNP